MAVGFGSPEQQNPAYRSAEEVSMSLITVSFLTLLFVFVSPLFPDDRQTAALFIEDILVRGNRAFSDIRIMSLINIAPGDTVEGEEVRQAIEELRRRPEFYSVKAEVGPGSRGKILVFNVKEVYSIPVRLNLDVHSRMYGEDKFWFDVSGSYLFRELGPRSLYSLKLYGALVNKYRIGADLKRSRIISWRYFGGTDNSIGIEPEEELLFNRYFIRNSLYFGWRYSGDSYSSIKAGSSRNNLTRAFLGSGSDKLKSGKDTTDIDNYYYGSINLLTVNKKNSAFDTKKGWYLSLSAARYFGNYRIFFDGHGNDYRFNQVWGVIEKYIPAGESFVIAMHAEAVVKDRLVEEKKGVDLIYYRATSHFRGYDEERLMPLNNYAALNTELRFSLYRSPTLRLSDYLVTGGRSDIEKLMDENVKRMGGVFFEIKGAVFVDAGYRWNNKPPEYHNWRNIMPAAGVGLRLVLPTISRGASMDISVNPEKEITAHAYLDYIF